MPCAGRTQGQAGLGFLGHACSAGLCAMAGSTRNSSYRQVVEPSRRGVLRGDRALGLIMPDVETHGEGKGRGEGQDPDAGARRPLLILLGVRL